MAEQIGRILSIECSNGETYASWDFHIEPFSPASFIVRSKAEGTKRFQIIPTRCVDCIWMEDIDAE